MLTFQLHIVCVCVLEGGSWTSFGIPSHLVRYKYSQAQHVTLLNRRQAAALVRARAKINTRLGKVFTSAGQIPPPTHTHARTQSRPCLNLPQSEPEWNCTCRLASGKGKQTSQVFPSYVALPTGRFCMLEWLHVVLFFVIVGGDKE